MFFSTARLKFAAGWAFRHLLVSVLVVALAASLVFFGWFPDPWRAMLGVATVFGLVVVVDLVCGPLLTLVLASPDKSKRERWIDLIFVGLIQLVALGYGLHSVYSARPVVLAFEVDRLNIVTANEVQVDQLKAAPLGLQVLPWRGVLHVTLRPAESPQEFLDSLSMSLGGVSQSMRPNWWTPYDEKTRAAIVAKAKPLTALIGKRPQDAAVLEQAAKRAGQPVSQLLYLPLTSSKEQSWVALIDASAKMVGYAPVDGFD
jgi:hypothetical protein